MKTSKEGTFIPFTVDVPRALDVLAAHLFHDPKQFVREIVSNAIDTCVASIANDPSIAITVKKRVGRVILSVRDSGVGMSRPIIEQVLPAFFGSTKRNDSTQIGQFGIGLYSALQFAEKVELFSNSIDGTTGTAATMTSSDGGVHVSDYDCEPGTEVVVHLSPEVPPVLKDKAALREFVLEIFVFSPVDIFFDGKIILGPRRAPLPWHSDDAATNQTAWPVFLERPKGQQWAEPRVVNVIRYSDAQVNLALFMSKASLREEFQDLRLYCRNVYVSPLPLSKDIAPLCSCLAGVINSSDISLTLYRQNVLTETATFDAFKSTLLRAFSGGFSDWAAKLPEDAKLYAREHRTALLQLAVNRENECGSMLYLVPFKSIAGQWILIEAIAQSNSGVVAYSFEDAAPAALEIGEAKAKNTILFSGDLEIKACGVLLAAPPKEGIKWKQIARDDAKHRVDHLSVIATLMLYTAAQACSSPCH